VPGDAGDAATRTAVATSPQCMGLVRLIGTSPTHDRHRHRQPEHLARLRFGGSFGSGLVGREVFGVEHQKGTKIAGSTQRGCKLVRERTVAVGYRVANIGFTN
jgi:hypothetical protein